MFNAPSKNSQRNVAVSWCWLRTERWHKLVFLMRFLSFKHLHTITGNTMIIMMMMMMECCYAQWFWMISQTFLEACWLQVLKNNYMKPNWTLSDPWLYNLCITGLRVFMGLQLSQLARDSCIVLESCASSCFCELSVGQPARVSQAPQRAKVRQRQYSGHSCWKDTAYNID